MRNVLAIAGKELRGYFASPIGYVLVGFYALLFGWFFYTLVAFFERQSMQMMAGQGGSLNVNQMLITPLLMNATVIMLLVFPLITMRTYAEEKRSGTIELLLTSPITDLQIILGKFLGALALFAAMLAVTVVHMALLFEEGAIAPSAAVGAANPGESRRAFPKVGLFGRNSALTRPLDQGPALAFGTVTRCYSEAAEATSLKPRVVGPPRPDEDQLRA